MELSSALSHQLQLHLQEIRNAKAQSMIDELNKAVQLAGSDLQAATARLTALEKQVGSDLPELRSLLDANSSDTSLRRTVSEIENELRQFRGTEKANRQLLALLKQALADPTRLVAAPNRLLDSQPALRRLKDGLVDAQLRTATLQGRMSAEHPEVISAKEAEAQVAARLHAELSTAIRGLESELAFDANRLEMLENQRNSAAARLARLAGLRATYTNLLSEADQPREVAGPGRAEPHQRPIQQRQRQGRQPDHPRRCPRHRHEPGQPQRADDRVGRRAGRPVDGAGHRSAHRAGHGEHGVAAASPAAVAPRAAGHALCRLCRAGGSRQPLGADASLEPDGRRAWQFELHPGPEGLERARQVQCRQCLPDTKRHLPPVSRRNPGHPPPGFCVSWRDWGIPDRKRTGDEKMKTSSFPPFSFPRTS